MNDHELLVAFKNGDHAAIEHVYIFHYRALCYFARGFVNNKEEAEDIVVETFIKLMRKQKDFDTLSDIQGFLYTATKNHCLDYLKHVKRKTASHKEIIYLLEKDENFIQAKIIKTELLKMIMAEAERLPPVRKKIFKLIFEEGLNTGEIAKQLNISVDTVRVQKAKAIASLRSAFLKDKLLLLAFMELVNKLPQ